MRRNGSQTIFGWHSVERQCALFLRFRAFFHLIFTFAASPQLSVVAVNSATGAVDGVMINEGERTTLFGLDPLPRATLVGGKGEAEKEEELPLPGCFSGTLPG